MLAGWSSGSKYPLLGSVRASAQMISYEAALGMTAVMVVLVSRARCPPGPSSTRRPNGFWTGTLIRLGVVPFIIFMIAITAELNRPPFDLVEAESELVGGFHTEYSSIRFAPLLPGRVHEHHHHVGHHGDALLRRPRRPHSAHHRRLHLAVPIIWFLVKTIAFCFIYVWFRAALPRLALRPADGPRVEALIPLSLGWLLIVAGS